MDYGFKVKCRVFHIDIEYSVHPDRVVIVPFLLRLSADKKSYKTGEKVRIRIPSSQKGIAIVSLENGSTFRDIRRIETTAGSSFFEFEATSSMCPNIYVFVTLIQPQQKRDNDHPIRMYK